MNGLVDGMWMKDCTAWFVLGYIKKTQTSGQSIPGVNFRIVIFRNVNIQANSRIIIDLIYRDSVKCREMMRDAIE